MAFFRRMLQRLFGRPRPRGGRSGRLTDPGEAERLGYDATPAGLQWSPGPRRPVEKSGWKPCRACGRLTPVVEDRVTRVVEVRTGGQRAPGGTVIEDGVTVPVEAVGSAGTWTCVCPFCGHCHVGAPGDHPDGRAQTACHECGTGLGTAVQCPECSFPRGWMTVRCPYCGNRQPVHAPHRVAGCDTFTLECVGCESAFVSLCIC